MTGQEVSLKNFHFSKKTWRHSTVLKGTVEPDGDRLKVVSDEGNELIKGATPDFLHKLREKGYLNVS